MLLPMRDLVKKYEIKASGIIHIGAHLGEELEEYLGIGVENILWVEANPKVYKLLCEKTKHHKGSRCLNAVISDIDDQEHLFRITNNGESSSILELKDHTKEHPQIYVQEIIRLKSVKFDTLVKRKNIKLDAYNFVSLDIQGAELMALRGMQETLKHCKYLYLEINTKELYSGCALKQDIVEFLSPFGFFCVQEYILEHGWGDALFIKTLKE